MQISPTVHPGVSPVETFEIAALDLRQAQRQLTFAPNERPNVVAAMTAAQASAAHAVSILSPLVASNDRFVSQMARESVQHALGGVTLLRDVLAAITNPLPGGEDYPDVAAVMESAKASFATAEGVLGRPVPHV